MAGRLLNVVGNSRIERFQQGQELQAHLVALHVSFQIGAVSYIGLVSLVQVPFDILARHAEQGTQDVAVTRLDARQAAKPSATNEVQKHRFHRVVAMVSHTDAVSIHVPTKLLEPVVAQLARSHLYAHLVQLGVLMGVEMGLVERYLPFSTNRLAKSLVPIRLAPAQMEVAMGCMDSESMFVQQQEQGDTICTSA